CIIPSRRSRSCNTPSTSREILSRITPWWCSFTLPCRGFMELPRETTVEALGKRWTFGRMSLSVLREFFARVRDWEGDPFADFERLGDRLPEADRAALFRECQARRDALCSLNLQDDLIKRYMATPEGMGAMARALLSAHHPDVDEDTAFAVL